MCPARRKPHPYSRETGEVQRMGGRSKGGIKWSRGAAENAGAAMLSQAIGTGCASVRGAAASVWAHFAMQAMTSGHADFCGQCGHGLVAGLWHGWA